MRVIIFFKILKILCKFQQRKKNGESSFCFLGNRIWSDCGKCSVLLKDFLSSAVNMLGNCPTISDITKRNMFQLYLPKSDEEIWSKCCRDDFMSVWDFLACWLSNDALKPGFLDIFLSASFRVHSFKNTEAIRVTFFSKMSKLWCIWIWWNISEMKSNI